MTAMFTYNQESGVRAGGSQYINKSGAYTGELSAKWTRSKSNGSQSAFLELSLKGDEGEANYMSICYRKKDGTDNQMGVDLINAMMGLLKIKALSSRSSGQDDICPELTGQRIGLVIQKVLYTKQDGSDGYKFEVKLPFSANSRKTLKEAVDNLPPTAVDAYAASIADKDDRNRTGGHAPQAQGSGGQRRPADEFEDDIPF